MRHSVLLHTLIALGLLPASCLLCSPCDALFTHCASRSMHQPFPAGWLGVHGFLMPQSANTGHWCAPLLPTQLPSVFWVQGETIPDSGTSRESWTWETPGETLRARAYYQKEFECSQQPSSKLESFGSQEWVVLFVPARCSCSSLSLPTPLLWVVYYTQATNEWEPLFYSTPHLQDLSLGLPQIWLINSRAPPS